MTDSPTPPIPQQLGFFGSDVDLKARPTDLLGEGELVRVYKLERQRWRDEAQRLPEDKRSLYLYYRQLRQDAKALDLLDKYGETP